MAKLTLEKVTYRYRNSVTPAVNQISCSFETGKLYTIIGPSGSGKSTLLSMLAGLDHPSEGDVFISEANLKEVNLKGINLDRYRRQTVSMIFQSFQLLPLFTVIENVCYPMELNGIHPKSAKQRAEQLLLSVGITQEKFKRFPSNLSGGEQQRVAIARSLASGATILIADEPTGNLDVANTENIMALLSKLAHEDAYCVIVVTHDLDVAKSADVRYKMKDGTISIE